MGVAAARSWVVCIIVCAGTTAVAMRQNGARDEVRRALDAYAAGDVPSISVPSAAALTQALDAVAPQWTQAAGPAEKLTRQRLVALWLLDATAGQQSPDRDGLKLIHWARVFLAGSGKADEFERRWLRASVEAMEPLLGFDGHIYDPPEFVDQLDYALKRFPDDARLRLTRVLLRPLAHNLTNRPAVSMDLFKYDALREGETEHKRGSPDRADLRSGPMSATVEDLGALLPDPEVGPEAATHLAMLDLARGDLDDSIETAEVARRAPDPYVRCFANLVMGLALSARHNETAASESFREASNAEPLARSAATAAAVREFAEGDRTRAIATLDRAYRGSSSDAYDPWQRPIALRRLLAEELMQLDRLAGRRPVRPRTSMTRAATASVTALNPVVPDGVDDRPHEAQGPPQVAPTFHALAQGVTIDVSVRSGDGAVLGLHDGDFSLLDNGVPQKLAAVDADAVPVDLSLVLEDNTQYSFRGQDPGPPGRQYRGDVATIRSALRPIDRLRVIAYERAVEVSSGDAPDYVAPPGLEGLSLYDALAAALIRETPPGHRSVIIAFGDGADATSITRAEDLRALVQRSAAVLFLLRRRTFEEGFVALAPGNPPSILGYLNPPDPTLAEDLARATGGDVRSGEGSGVGAFRQIFDDFRQRYLLHYQPAGVPPDGWHDVSVRVIRPGKFQVSARKGYMAGGG